jgi:hypothetical protein
LNRNYAPEALYIGASDDFLDAVRAFLVPRQSKMPPSPANGGGMFPPDPKRAHEQLTRKNDAVARRCLREIERANQRQ